MRFLYQIFLLSCLLGCSFAALEKRAIEEELKSLSEEYIRGKEVSLVFFNHSKNEELNTEIKSKIIKILTKQLNALGYVVVPEVRKGHLLIKIHIEDDNDNDVKPSAYISLYGDIQEWGKRARPFFQYTNISYNEERPFKFQLSSIPIKPYIYYQDKIREENIYVKRNKDPGCFFTIGFLAKCREETCIIRKITETGQSAGVQLGDELLSFNGFGASYVINNSAYDFVYSGRDKVLLKIRRKEKLLDLESPLQEYCIDEKFFRSNKS